MQPVVVLMPPCRGGPPHRQEVASTGPASERPLLVSGVPAAAPEPGEPSSPACGARPPAARGERQRVRGRSQALGWTRQATPPYRLLRIEQETAQLRIGSWVGEAEYRTLGRSLPALRHLVGRSSSHWCLLIGRHGRSHGHLEAAGEKVLTSGKI